MLVKVTSPIAMLSTNVTLPHPFFRFDTDALSPLFFMFCSHTYVALSLSLLK